MGTTIKTTDITGNEERIDSQTPVDKYADENVVMTDQNGNSVEVPASDVQKKTTEGYAVKQSAVAGEGRVKEARIAQQPATPQQTKSEEKVMMAPEGKSDLRSPEQLSVDIAQAQDEMKKEKAIGAVDWDKVFAPAKWGSQEQQDRQQQDWEETKAYNQQMAAASEAIHTMYYDIRREMEDEGYNYFANKAEGLWRIMEGANGIVRRSVDRRKGVEAATRNMMAEIDEMMDASKDRGVIGNTLVGIAEGATNVDTYSFGLIGLEDMMTLADAYERSMNGTSSAEDERLLKVAALKGALQQYHEAPVAREAGKFAGEMIPFMVTMNLGGGLMRAAGTETKQMVYQMVKRYGNKEIMAKIGSTAAGMAAEGAVATITFNAANTTRDAMQRNMGQATMGEMGQVKFEGGESMADAAGKAFGASMTMFGTLAGSKSYGKLMDSFMGKLFSKTGTLVPDVLKKGAAVISPKNVMQAINENSQWVKGFAENAHWNSPLGMVTAFKMNEVLNAATIGDYDFTTGERGVFNLKNNLQLVMGIGLTEGVMTAARVTEYSKNVRDVNRRIYRPSVETLKEQMPNDWHDVMQIIDGCGTAAEFEEAADNVIEAMRDKGVRLSARQKSAIRAYAHASAVKTGMRIGMNKLAALNEGIEGMYAREYQAGYNNIGLAGLQYDAAVKTMGDAFGEQSETVMAQLRKHGDKTLDAIRKTEGATDEQKAAAEMFLKAVRQRQGAMDRMEDAANEAVLREQANIDKLTCQSDGELANKGEVVKVRLKDGREMYVRGEVKTSGKLMLQGTEGRQAELVDKSEVEGIVSKDNAAQLKASIERSTGRQVENDLMDIFEGSEAIEAGQKIDVNGTELTVLSVDSAGNVTVTGDGGQTTEVVPMGNVRAYRRQRAVDEFVTEQNEIAKARMLSSKVLKGDKPEGTPLKKPYEDALEEVESETENVQEELAEKPDPVKDAMEQFRKAVEAINETEPGSKEEEAAEREADRSFRQWTKVMSTEELEAMDKSRMDENMKDIVNGEIASRKAEEASAMKMIPVDSEGKADWAKAPDREVAYEAMVEQHLGNAEAARRTIMHEATASKNRLEALRKNGPELGDDINENIKRQADHLRAIDKAEQDARFFADLADYAEKREFTKNPTDERLQEIQAIEKQNVNRLSETLKDAEAGLQTDAWTETRLAPEVANAIDRYAKAMDQVVVFVDGFGQAAQGKNDNGRVIMIEKDNKSILTGILAHESIHALKRTNEAAYDEIVKLMKTEDAWDNVRKNREDKYKKAYSYMSAEEYDKAIEEETVTKMAEDMFSDWRAFKWLLDKVENQPSIVDKFWDMVERVKDIIPFLDKKQKTTLEKFGEWYQARAKERQQLRNQMDEDGQSGEKFSVREKPAPENTIKAYKLMRLEDDGELYPLYIGSSEPVKLQTWYDADAPDFETMKKMPAGIHLMDMETGESMTYDAFFAEHPELFGKKQTKFPTVEAINYATDNGLRWVSIKDTAKTQKRYGESRQYYNLGINGSGAVGEFAMRPGWHAGSHPVMRQIGKGSEKNLRDDKHVWTEIELAADVDYNEEAQSNPDKDLPGKMPEDGFYLKATNADKKKSQADNMGWYVSGAMKVNRILSDAEAREAIDEWNMLHPDKKLDYDYERESGKMFDGEKLVENNNERFSVKDKKKTATTMPRNLINDKHNATVSDANVILDKESKKIIKDDLRKLTNVYKGNAQIKGFLTDLKRAIGVPYDKLNEASGYRTFKSEDGSTLTVRISNHNSVADKFKERGYDADEAVAIVIKSKRTRNTFKPNDDVDMTEHVYMIDDIKNADGNTLSKIAESISEMLDTGVYIDKTGIERTPNVSGKGNLGFEMRKRMQNSQTNGERLSLKATSSRGDRYINTVRTNHNAVAKSIRKYLEGKYDEDVTSYDRPEIGKFKEHVAYTGSRYISLNLDNTELEIRLANHTKAVDAGRSGRVDFSELGDGMDVKIWKVDDRVNVSCGIDIATSGLRSDALKKVVQEMEYWNSEEGQALLRNLYDSKEYAKAEDLPEGIVSNNLREAMNDEKAEDALKESSQALREAQKNLDVAQSEYKRNVSDNITKELVKEGNVVERLDGRLWLNYDNGSALVSRGEKVMMNYHTDNADLRAEALKQVDEKLNECRERAEANTDHSAVENAEREYRDVLSAYNDKVKENDWRNLEGIGEKFALKDEDYNAAIEEGDTEKLNSIVRKAFKEKFPDTKVVDENGEPLVVYHDTNAKALINKETGQNWDDLDMFEKHEWKERGDMDDYWEEKDFHTFSDAHARESIEIPGFFFAPEMDAYHEYGDRTIRAYLDMKNPIIDPVIPNAGVTDHAGRDAMEQWKAQGYDGIIRTEDGRPYEYAVFSPEQIKSAEPIERDDDGNIIPLSERFNPKKKDFRFSLKDQEEFDEKGGYTMTDAASADSGERLSIKTEDELETAIKGFANSDKTKGLGWVQQQVDDIVKETRDLIEFIHAGINGDKNYDEFASKDATMRVDWRDGVLKPVVTWVRGNVEYKYDMSADTFCINNEGMETVLASPVMADLMVHMAEFGYDAKASDEGHRSGFKSEDYTRLYATLRDKGFVVPCKGCFDAAARLKMLPSVAQNFVDLVNKTIDERNRNPKKFDAALRKKAKGATTANGLPVSAGNKADAVKVGVAGDNLTEHISWTQLMSAEGQTKALSDWGGIFRAWQRTGAGRPKDKLMPEPYTGQIMTTTTTIIGPMGDRTPSFRDMDVNVGTGLRRNSHSEFRPVLAVDEMQFMRDCWLKGLQVFKYMKELDDVRLFGNFGVKYNMSSFPAFEKGGVAAGLDANGGYTYAEESVGGREFPYEGEDGRTHYDGRKGFEEARKYVNKDVSISNVAFSVPHLIKLMTDVPTPSDKSGDYGSIIPFHASSATREQLAVQGLGTARGLQPGTFMAEAFSDYDKGVTNFEDVHNDRFGEGWRIVKGKKEGTDVTPGHKIEFANGTIYRNDAMGITMYASEQTYRNAGGKRKFGISGAFVTLDSENNKEAHSVNVDYNDKVRELGGDYAYKEAADYYIPLLRKYGLLPRFDFEVPEDKYIEMCEKANVDPKHPKLGWKGEGNGWNPCDAESYYSLFCDYGMTDPETGKLAPHRPVLDGQKNADAFRKALPENFLDIIKAGVDRYSERKASEDAMIGDAVREYVKRSIADGKMDAKTAAEILQNHGISAEGIGNGERYSLKEKDNKEILKDVGKETSNEKESIILNNQKNEIDEGDWYKKVTGDAIGGSRVASTIRRAKGILGESGSGSGTEGKKSWTKESALSAIERASKEEGTFINPDVFSDYEKMDQRGESEVYRTNDNVIKVNNFLALDFVFRVNEFLDRLKAHNEFAKDVPYEILGFTKNEEGETCIVLSQPYVDGVHPTQDAIDHDLESRGFHREEIQASEDGTIIGWANEKYTIWDTKPDNVIVDKDGDFHYIDTFIQHRNIPNHSDNGRFSLKDNADRVESIDAVDDDQVKMRIEKGQNVKGWYDKNTGRVKLYGPNIKDDQDAERTIVTETVKAVGLKGLTGDEGYAKMMDDVYEHMGEDVRTLVTDLMDEGLTKEDAVARVMSEIASGKSTVQDAESLWASADIALKAHAENPIEAEMLDGQTRYLAWANGRESEGTVADAARDIVMRKQNGVGEYDNDERLSVKDNDDQDISGLLWQGNEFDDKPRMLAGESQQHFLNRVRDWQERMRLKQEAENDPMPQEPQYGENVDNGQAYADYQERYEAWAQRQSQREERMRALERGEAGDVTIEDAMDEIKRPIEGDELRRTIRGEIRERRRMIEVENFNVENYIHDLKKRLTKEQLKAIPFLLEETLDGEPLPLTSQFVEMIEQAGMDASELRALRNLLRGKGDMNMLWTENEAVKRDLQEFRSSLTESERQKLDDAIDSGTPFSLMDYTPTTKEGMRIKGTYMNRTMCSELTGAMETDAVADMYGNKMGEVLLNNEVLRQIAVLINPDKIDIEMTPELEQALGEVRQWFEQKYQDMDSVGMFDGSMKGKHRDQYVTHIWDFGKSDKKAVENYLAATRTSSPYTNRRDIDTIREGLEMGLVPKYDDITGIISEYGHYANEAIANRKLIKFLEGLSVEGKDAIVKNDVRDPDYVDMNNIALLGRKVHKALVADLDVIFGGEKRSDNPAFRAIGYFFDGLGAVQKQINLSYSFFHALALTETNVGIMGFGGTGKTILRDMIWNAAIKGKLDVPAFNDPELTKDAVKHFVKLGATNDVPTAAQKRYVKNIADWLHEHNVYGVDYAAYGIDKANNFMDALLWDHLHDGYKLYSFHTLAKDIRKRAEKEGWDNERTERALDEAGQFVNDTFGGQHWDLLNVSPEMEKWLRRFLLSPDWTISTTRQALSVFGFGSLYNDDGFWKGMLKRNENQDVKSLRRKLGTKFWLMSMTLWPLFYNALNAWNIKRDEDYWKEEAERRRKTDPDYKSPYELAYPDGMKWWDYTMLGNSGDKTRLFIGRDSQGREMYARWGKQFREVPELFYGHEGFSVPGAAMTKLAGKVNPLANTIITMTSGYSLSGFESPYMKDKTGLQRNLGILAVLATSFIPYSVPTDEEKEFVWVDLFMPTNKGYSPWKAQRGFRTAILADDADMVEAVYKSCVMNGIDPDAQLKIAMQQVDQDIKKEQMDGVKDLDDAIRQFDKEKNVVRKRELEKFIKKQMLGQNLKPTEKAQFVQNAIDAVKGNDVDEDSSLEYDKLKTVDDLMMDERIRLARQKARAAHDKVKKGDKSEEVARQNTAYYIIERFSSPISKCKKALKGTDRDAQEAKMKTIRKLKKSLIKSLNGRREEE